MFDILSFLKDFYIALVVIGIISYFLLYNFHNICGKLLEFIEHPQSPRKYDNDCVYLYQHRGGSKAPSLNPESLLIETYLKFYKIKHKCIYSSLAKSKTGVLPFIVYNHQEISKVSNIIKFLNSEFDIKSHLSERDEIIAADTIKVINNNIGDALLYFKVIKHHDELFQYLLKLTPYLLAKIAYFKLYYMARDTIAEGPYSESPEQEIYSDLDIKLKSLSEMLGDKKYLFGNEPTIADFALFGQLCVHENCYNDYPLNIMFEKYPNLKKYTEDTLYELYPRFKLTY